MFKQSKLYRVVLAIQLTLPRAAVGWLFAILTSNYNRIAIHEMGIAAVTITTMLGLYHFMSPFQVIFGRMADRFPVFGYRRSPYILMGLLLSAIAVALLPQTTLAMSNGEALGYAGSFFLLIVFGVGFAMSGVTHLSLVADVVPEKQRGIQVAMIWAMLLVGMIVSLSFIRKAMPEYSFEQMQSLYASSIPIVVGLTLLSLIGVETRMPKGSEQLKNFEDTTPVEAPFRSLVQFLRGAATGDSTRNFFLFILIAMLGINLQDNILEVFGAEVLGLTVGETGRFQQVWGSGSLVGMFIMGVLTLKTGITKLAAITAGVVGIFLSMSLLAFAGYTADRELVTIALISFGFFNGFFLVGSLTTMMEMTTNNDRGSYMGLWGLGLALASGLASMLGGALVSGFIETELLSAKTGYAGIFLFEAILVLSSLYYIRRVDTDALRAIDRDELTDAMAADI